MEQTEKAFETLITYIKEASPTIEKRLDEIISDRIEQLACEISDALEDCKTPIEKLFAIPFYERVNESKLNFLADIFEVRNQAEILINDKKKYIVDFKVEFLKQENNTAHYFVIECDGHEFHEKTKEQVAKDKQRERDLMKSGYIVIRFSGSEIHESPTKCAREAIKIIEEFVIHKLRR